MNLLSLAERWGEALASKSFDFAADRCLHAVDKFSACTACYEVCPTNAIQPGKPPVFASDSCQVCRACLPVCPTGAFSADDEAQALLRCAGRMRTKTCEVVCGLNPNVETGVPEATAVRVRGCLAGLGTGVFLGLVSQGLNKVIVRLDACVDCPWSELRPQIVNQVQQAQSLLALWDLVEAVNCLDEVADDFGKRPLWNAASPPLSRRDLFHQQTTGKKPAAESEENDSPNQFHERLRILRAVRQLPPPTHQRESDTLAVLGFALLAVNDDCTACGVCARVCPTGALQMETAGSSFQLTFSPQICFGCDVCSHVCSPNAITLAHDPTYNQVFSVPVDQVVQRGNLTPCRKCRTLFAEGAGSDLCPVCDFRRQNPFGSALPPGLLANQRQKRIRGKRRIEL